MTVLIKPMYMELVDRSSQRVIFSAALDAIDKTLFDELWARIADSIWRETENGCVTVYYEIRITGSPM